MRRAGVDVNAMAKPPGDSLWRSALTTVVSPWLPLQPPAMGFEASFFAGAEPTGAGGLQPRVG
jgi:hypothetical protein